MPVTGDHRAWSDAYCTPFLIYFSRTLSTQKILNSFMVIWRTSRRYTGIIALTEYMSINFQFAHPYLCVVPRASKNPCLFLQPNQVFLCTVPDSDGCINGWVSNIPNTDQRYHVFLCVRLHPIYCFQGGDTACVLNIGPLLGPLCIISVPPAISFLRGNTDIDNRKAGYRSSS